jgi:hypothetical protein
MAKIKRKDWEKLYENPREGAGHRGGLIAVIVILIVCIIMYYCGWIG